MKVLLITNKVNTYALGFQNIINPLIQLGHEVVWAADFSRFNGDKNIIPCKIIQISINSNPINKGNIDAYKTLKKVIIEEKIEAIQCNTPIGGLLGRLVGKRMKVPIIIYAAHGFLFFKGAPLINQTLYKWEELFLAHYTDVLITITQEDYNAAQKFHLRNGGKLYLIHGAGIEVGKSVTVDKTKKREELGIPEDAFVLVSGGFLNKNKNNHVIIRALGKIKDDKVYYVVCGDGEELDTLKILAKKNGVENRVLFLGFRTDFAEIMAVCDVFVMPSFREGVPRSLLEAMDLGLPCIGSRTRGIKELIGENEGGYLCNPRNPDDFVAAIMKLKNQPKVVKSMINRNKREVYKYSKEVVCKETTVIYKEVLR